MACEHWSRECRTVKAMEAWNCEDNGGAMGVKIQETLGVVQKGNWECYLGAWGVGMMGKIAMVL